MRRTSMKMRPTMLQIKLPNITRIGFIDCGLPSRLTLVNSPGDREAFAIGKKRQ
jgi:hypothetical protein